MRRKRDRIYRRCDYCADFFIPQGVDQLVHPRGVITGKFNTKRQTTILGSGGEATSHPLHKLSLIVLREGQNLLEARWSRASGCIAVECREYRRHGQTGGPLFGADSSSVIAEQYNA